MDLLDLHPLPDGASLLLHLTNRFSRVVDALEGRHQDLNARRQETAPWHIHREDETEARKCWKKLQRCVAAGWDSNVRQRSAQLDIDAYVIEMQQALREQLDVRSCFTAFLDALNKEFRECHHTGKDPVLFVVAIDDADMNPQRSVELLDCLRKLWHPHLAFVLTGNSKLFVRTLQEHCLGVILRPLQGLSLQSVGEDDVQRTAEANQLAEETYDKVVPPGHRAKLPPLRPSVRFTHKAADIKGALERVKINPEKRPELTVASYLKTNPQLCEALPDRLRGLINLRAAVDQLLIRDRASHRAASVLAMTLWQDSLRSTFIQSIVLDPNAKLNRIVSIDEETGSLRIDLPIIPPGPVWSSRSIRPVANFHRPETPGAVTFEQIGRLEADLAGGHRLPQSATAALMLAANIAADQPGGQLLRNPSALNGFEPIFAFADYRNQLGVRFVWPLPKGTSFIDLAVISSRWNALVYNDLYLHAWPEDFDRQVVDSMAKQFLRLVILTLTDTNDDEHIAKPWESWEWPELATHIMTLVRQDGLLTTWALEGKTWARCRAGLLAAPESGLTVEGAAAWLVALHSACGDDERQWIDQCEGLVTERRRRAAAALDLSTDAERVRNPRVEDILRRIDTKFSERKHPWSAVEKAGVAALVAPPAPNAPPALKAPPSSKPPLARTRK